MSRRNALKTGAALGVGAAVLAGPSIGILGSAPAYAQTCSRGKTCIERPKESTNNGAGNCVGSTAFNNLPTQITENGISVNFGGSCFNGSDTATVTSTLRFCQICVVLYEQRSPTVRTSYCTAVSESDVLTLPSIPDGNNPSLKADVSVCCSDERSCF